MLDSVRHREQELLRSLKEIQQLAHGLKNQIVYEREQATAHPIIALPKHLDEAIDNANDENDISGPTMSDPVTPPKIKYSHESHCSNEIALVESSDSSVIEFGRLRARADSHDHKPSTALTVPSPAHSCPTIADAALNQPFLDKINNKLKITMKNK